MTEEPILQISTEADDFYSLEIKKKDFKDFLEGILGDRRQLKKRLPIGFVANFADILNLHQRIYQRTLSQNVSVVDTFSCRIFYNDRTERSINDRFAFEALNETSRASLNRMTLNYSFLLQFTGRPYPEKQVVRVDLDTSYKFDTAARYNSELRMPREEWPCMTIEVDYTNISWGEDLLGLIDRFCYDRFFSPGRSGLTDKKFLFYLVSWTGLIAGGIFFLYRILSYKGALVIAQHHKIVTSEPNPILARLDALMIDERSISLSGIDYINIFWSGVPFLSFLVIMVLLSLIEHRSYVILNNSMARKMQEDDRDTSLLYIGVFVSFFVGVVAGITANYFPFALSKIFGGV